MRKLLLLFLLSLSVVLISCADPTPVSRTTTTTTTTEQTRFSVVLRGNGGTPIARTINVTYGKPMPNVSKPSRYGYTFLGYYNTMYATGKMYYDSNMNSVRNWDLHSNDTLYAVWQYNL